MRREHGTPRTIPYRPVALAGVSLAAFLASGFMMAADALDLTIVNTDLPPIAASVEDAWAEPDSIRQDEPLRQLYFSPAIAFTKLTFEFQGESKYASDLPFWGKEYSVGQLDFAVAAFDKKARLSYRQESSYDRNIGDLLAHLNQNRPYAAGFGAERLWDVPDPGGTAYLARFELDVIEHGAFQASVFSDYSEAAGLFHSKPKPKDIFADLDKSRTRFGGQLKAGPVSFRLEHAVSTELKRGDDASEQSNKITAALDLTTWRDRLSATWPKGVRAITPTSVWVAADQGRIGRKLGEEGPDDRTEGYSFGASWEFDSGTASVSYWNKHHDMRKLGAEEYDWTGSGVDISAGIYRARWGIGGTLSHSRSLDHAPLSATESTDIGGSISFYLFPAKDLKLFGDVSLGNGLESSSYGEQRAEYWSSVLGVDISRLIWDGAEIENHIHPSLRFYYIAKEADGSQNNKGAEHLLAFEFKNTF